MLKPVRSPFTIKAFITLQLTIFIYYFATYYIYYLPIPIY